MTLLRRLNDIAERAATIIAVACFLGFVAVTAAEAFSRYALSHSLLWTNEVARLLFIWSVFLAAAVGFRHQQHLAVDLFPIRTDSLADRLQRRLVHGITLVMCIAWAWYGYEVLTSGMLRKFAVIGIPIGYGFAAIPVMGVIATLFLVEHFLAARRLTSGLEREPVQPEVLQAADGKASAAAADHDEPTRLAEGPTRE